jgi:dCTP deaminase
VILTDGEILKAINAGDLEIEPFQLKQLGPNSYDVRLMNVLKVYERPGMAPLDLKEDNPTIDVKIPEEGLELVPGKIYIGSTAEVINSKRLIPMMDGRSSLGRLGVNVHITAGFGDYGFCGRFTAEITAVEPVLIYPGIRFAQIWWARPQEAPINSYKGKYQNQKEPVPSRSWKDWYE